MGLNFIKRIRQVRDLLHVVIGQKNNDKGIQVTNFLNDNLFNNPKYTNSKRLNKAEYQVFSQNGEDGIIAEIFNRIGTTNKYFIEFGVENGLECNSANLLYKQWNGLWIEGSKNHYNDINSRFKDLVDNGQLQVKNQFITAENIESIFDSANAPTEPDLLSIDIDNNDYYIWDSITKYNPRVVIVEYNSIFRPDTHFVVRYKPDRTWDSTSYFGASLLALQQLADKKGYCLVGCVFTGSNAFFVRKDLVGDKFEAPYTAENHYEPNRDFLYYKAGHPKNHRPD
ncbi:hypothetical protein [Mucilaginibacter sp. UYCu711]|uniref:hypothetical protein n=1 Tax=Mucilaginibacter sp. UYCu711 TaxID=3156339 RepID=UPI003D1F7692